MNVAGSAILHAGRHPQPDQNVAYPGSSYPPGSGYPPPTYPPAGDYSHGGYPPPSYYPPPAQTQPGYVQPSPYGQPSYYQPQPPPQAYDPYGSGKPTAGKPGGYGASAQNPISYDTPNSEMLGTDTSTSIRHAFVRKVYLILTTQLVYTFGFGLMFSLVESMRVWLNKYWWVALIFGVVGLILMIAVTCCSNLARQVPTNFILLSLITICISWLIAVAGATTSSTAFAIAAGITAVVAVGLTIFAIQTRWDFTGCHVFAFVAALILLVFGILAAIIRNDILSIVYASLGAALFSFFLVMDTQQIVGGKHRKYQYSVDDYILGALTLYMDVVNLFLFILSLTGSAQN